MPARIKERVNKGVTNKPTKKSGSSDCVCGMCTCGKHRCAVNNGTSIVVGAARFEGSSGYHDDYAEKPISPRKDFKPPHPMPPADRRLEGTSETKDQFIARELPAKVPVLFLDLLNSQETIDTFQIQISLKGYPHRKSLSFNIRLNLVQKTLNHQQNGFKILNT